MKFQRRAEPKPTTVQVVYVKNTETFDERVIQVVPSEEEARAIEYKLGLKAPQTIEWETVEVRDAVVHPLEHGDTLYLLSEGGPSDDEAEAHSPNAVAAFTRRESVDKFLKEPKNREYMVDLRLRTLQIGVPLT